MLTYIPIPGTLRAVNAAAEALVPHCWANVHNCQGFEAIFDIKNKFLKKKEKQSFAHGFAQTNRNQPFTLLYPRPHESMTVTKAKSYKTHYDTHPHVTTSPKHANDSRMPPKNASR
jgi:hypothetical protein